MKSILVIEDDAFIRDILSYTLTNEAFIVYEASTGSEAISIVKNNEIHMILSDIMLPDTDGLSLFEKISSLKKIPTIFLTAKNDISDKLKGIELGADDYITKPFDIREVIARVNMVLRRTHCEVEDTDKNTLTVHDRIVIHKDSHEVFVDSNLVPLKPKEFQLLLILAENRNVVLSREQLLSKVWGYSFEGDSRTVDVHIQRIRKKIGDTKKDSVIKTIFGVGYKMP